MRLFWVLALIVTCLRAAPGEATVPVLAVTVHGVTRQFTAAELLGRPDAASLTIPQDVSYHRAMTYRVVPLRALLSMVGRDAADTIEVRATDGFVAQIPRALIDDKAVPWVAIEDPKHPWPNLPKKTVSAGPFYLVWQHTDRGDVSPEQWAYAMAALTTVKSPVQRWPVLAVDGSVPANSPVRRGQTVVIVNCLACHRLGGSGGGTVGPDLMRPMPAQFYLTDAGLRALVRNPAAVRSWPGQQMPAFSATVIGDADLDAAIAYLNYLARHR